MTTLVCFALKEEAAPFYAVAAGKPGVFTAIVGIGRQNAERTVRSFLQACSPALVFTCGFAGGLNPDLKIGDVVFEMGQRPATRDQESLATADEHYEQLVAAGAKPVKFVCTDRIATTVAEKRQLRSTSGADAVEMESAAIHAVCQERGIPCITVRAISDPADEDLPLDFNLLSKPDKSLDFGKLALAIAKAPGKISALLALQKKTSLAAKQLAAVLAKVMAR